MCAQFEPEREDMRQVRVLVAEDHPLMVEAVKLALAESAEFEVVGTTDSGNDVVVLTKRLRPDLVLLDLSLADGDGLEVLRAVRRSNSDVAVVILSGHDDANLVTNALREGASGFISKRIDPYDLPAALRQVLDPTLFRPAAASDGSGPAAAGELTARDEEVLRALLDGLSNKQIGERLWLTEQTVKARLTSLYRKLGVSSRTEAVAVAYGRGFKGSSPAEQKLRRLTGS
jgi:two-component system nitrate/nitrite response regulator NarL